MKKLVASLVLGLLSAMSVMAQTKPAGDGTEASPYLIGTAQELVWFRQLVNNELTDGTAGNASAHAELTKDIDLSSVCGAAVETANGTMAVNWRWIGTLARPFTGVFNGGGFKISNVYMNYSANKYEYTGFFGHVSGATIQNLTLSGALLNMDYTYCCGLLAGEVIGSVIDNVVVYGSLSSSGYYMGGLIGVVRGKTNTTVSKVNNCHNHADVNAGRIAGGIVGNTEGYVYITNCSNYGFIQTQGEQTGGIASNSTATIQNCANYGKVSGTKEVGGIAGKIYGSASQMVLANCYNSGKIICTSPATSGMLVGTLTNGAKVENNVCNKSIVMLGEGASTIYQKPIFGGGVYTHDGVTLFDENDLRTGEAAAILQGSQDDALWGQQLGVDAQPLLALNAPRVYRTGDVVDCSGWAITNVTFSNTRGAEVSLPHQYEEGTGICTVCAAEMPLLQDADGYYLIASGACYVQFQALVAACATSPCTYNARQTADVDLSRHLGTYPTRNTIGSYASLYGGIYDGAGYKIVGAHFVNSGMFANTRNATIKGVNITGTISDANRTGLLVASMQGGTLTDCTASGRVSTSTATYTTNAGLVGVMFDGAVVERCANYAEVSGKVTLGGVCGNVQTSDCSIIDCLNLGSVTGQNNVGGIVGIFSVGTLRNVVSAGNITCTDASGSCGYICGRTLASPSTYVNMLYLPSATLTLGGEAASARLAMSANSSITSQWDLLLADATKYDMANGEAAYVLDGGRGVWGQNIGTDVCPLIGGQKVYSSTVEKCDGRTVTLDGPLFTNVVPNIHYDEESGYCWNCWYAQEPEQAEDGYYLIANAGNLAWFRNKVNAEGGNLCARQTESINLEYVCHPRGGVLNWAREANWVPIGENMNWYGKYDGQNKSIEGLYQNLSTNAGGLFYFLGVNGDVEKSKQAELRNIYLKGTVKVDDAAPGNVSGSAILCAINTYGTIVNCSTLGSVTTNAPNVGGIVGLSLRVARIDSCQNSAKITTTYTGGDAGAGGIMGAGAAQIRYCTNSGAISDGGAGVRACGGIAGVSRASSANYDYGIAYCANKGAMTVGATSGGIVGKMTGNAPITSCYNNASVASSYSASDATYEAARKSVVPLIAGNSGGAPVSKLYYNGSLSYTGDDRYGEPCTADQVKNGSLTHKLGNPWGQRVDKGRAQAVPYLWSYAVYKKADGSFTNYPSIMHVTEVINRLPLGTATLEEVQRVESDVLEK